MNDQTQRFLVEAVGHLSDNSHYRNLLVLLSDLSAEADRLAIYASQDADVWRGRARGIREVIDIMHIQTLLTKVKRNATAAADKSRHDDLRT